MQNAPSTSSAHEMAAAVINTAVTNAEKNGKASPKKIADDVEVLIEMTGAETPEAKEYVTMLRDKSHAYIVTTLPDGIGGLNTPNSTEVAASTLKVDEKGGIAQTIDRAKETKRHEIYHAVNNHTAPIATYGSEEAESTEVEPTDITPDQPTEVDDTEAAVVVGNKEFEVEEFVEGVTVLETGANHVSGGYKGHKSDVESAMAQANLTIGDVRQALNKDHDLSQIDDRARKVTPALAI